MHNVIASSSDNTTNEVRQLRRTLRDLVALSTLPAVWHGLDIDRFARSFGDVVLNALGLELVYIRLTDFSDRGCIEVVCSKEQRADIEHPLHQVRAAFESHLTKINGQMDMAVPNPIGTGTLHVATAPLGFAGDYGIVIAGSRQNNFPSEHDRLVLGAAANHAAVALERRRAEIELQESREQLKAVFDSSGDGIYVIGPDALCTFINQAGAMMLGYQPEELVGRSLREIVDLANPDSRHYPLEEHHIARAAREGIGARVTDGAFWSKSGTVVPVAYSVSPMMMKGRLTGAVVTFNDISEQKRAEQALRTNEEALRESSERLSAALAASKTGTFRWDILTNTLDWDENLDRLFGLGPGQTVRSLDQFVAMIHPEDRAGVIEACEQCARDGVNFRMDYRVIWSDGSVHWLDDRGQTIVDAQGRPVYMTGACVDITDRKAIQDALRKEEEDSRHAKQLLEAALGASKTGTFRWNPHTEEFLVFDDRLKRLFGFKQEEPIRVTEDFIARVHPHDIEAVVAAVEQCRHGADFEMEYRVIHPDGSIHWLFDRAKMERDVDGTPAFLVGACTDITKQKELHAAAQAAIQRFRFLAETMPQKVFTATPDGNVDYFNPQWTAFTGLTFEQICDWGWTQFIHPDDVAENVRVWKHSIDTGEPFQFEHRFRHKNGEYHWHISRALPLRDDTDRIVMWLGSNTDIQEIKAAQEELRQALERERSRAAVMARLAAASKSMNAILSMESIARILCEEARIIFDASVSLVTLSPKDGDNREVTIVSPSAQDARFRSYLESPAGLKLRGLACRTGRPTRLAPDNIDIGVAWVALQESGQGAPEAGGWLGTPLLSHDGKNIGLIQLFRTGNRKFSADAESVLEQLAAIAVIGIENARLYERLREQDTRKDEFLATLAHELRNPLAPITTGLAILRNGRPEMTGKIVDMMERQMGHLVRLVDDVLDVSRVTSGKIALRKERVTLKHVIDTALETSQPLMEQAGHMLTVDMPRDHAIWLEVDYIRMVQVLTNLLNNAAKYTPPGGRIRLTSREENQELVVQVIDNGIGIPQDMLPRVFELFTQVKGALDRSQGGLGLGLALVRRLVEMHGGTVDAASGGYGAGSTFSIRLPMEPAASVTQEADTIDENPAYQPRGQRILVVDDNVDAAETLAMTLAISGHEIATAYTGPAAVETARRFKPDVAFLDIGLPGMNGYEVAGVLRGSCPTLIALTGWGAENDRQRAKEAGFDFHLTKPVSAEKVKELLAMASDRQAT